MIYIYRLLAYTVLIDFHGSFFNVAYMFTKFDNASSAVPEIWAPNI